MTTEKSRKQLRKWEKRKKQKKRAAGTVLALLAAVLLTACANPFVPKDDGGESSGAERIDTGFVVTGPESYDSADTAILESRDEEENTITFLNLELGKKYTLSIDGTTGLYDKYGESISAEQLQKGDIVDITFLKSEKHLVSLKLSGSAWSYEAVERYEINTVRGEVSIGAETFKLTSETLYVSEGREIDSIDLSPADILSFYGIGNQVLTVRVDKGHGYLRLENDENFLGGWIEVGQSVVERITEDMLLLVPEGNYQVNISNNGGGGIKRAVIRRNEETTLDIGDLEVPEPQYGMVLFSLAPSFAELYIDGEKVDAAGPVSLEYGLHQLIARAEGYQSITQYIRVAQESAGINVVLDPNTDEDEKDGSSTSSATGSDDTTTGYYKVYIDAPEEVEVYLDGSYVGIAPCSFKKTEGTHVITLRKNGYTTRSYTVQIDGEEKDISYSFAELQKTSTTVSGGE